MSTRCRTCWRSCCPLTEGRRGARRPRGGGPAGNSQVSRFPGTSRGMHTTGSASLPGKSMRRDQPASGLPDSPDKYLDTLGIRRSSRAHPHHDPTPTSHPPTTSDPTPRATPPHQRPHPTSDPTPPATPPHQPRHPRHDPPAHHAGAGRVVSVQIGRRRIGPAPRWNGRPGHARPRRRRRLQPVPGPLPLEERQQLGLEHLPAASARAGAPDGSREPSTTLNLPAVTPPLAAVSPPSPPRIDASTLAQKRPARQRRVNLRPWDMDLGSHSS